MQPASANTALIEATNALAKGEAEIHDGADHGFGVYGPAPPRSRGDAVLRARQGHVRPGAQGLRNERRQDPAGASITTSERTWSGR